MSVVDNFVGKYNYYSQVHIKCDQYYVQKELSMTGHEIGAAGSNELIYTVLMMQNNFIAPNINIEEIDEDCQGIHLVVNDAIEVPIHIAMSNSFGFGGVNTCLILENI